MDISETPRNVPALRDLLPQLGFDTLGSHRSRGLPGIADALGIERRNGGVPNLGGVPGIFDILSLGEPQSTASASSVLQVVNLQINISVVRVTGASVPAEDAFPTGDALTPEATAGRIVDFATGLFPVFQEQNPELSEEEALTQFEQLVREAIDEGFADAQQILEGLGRLDEETQGLLADLRAAVDAALDAFFNSEPGEAAEGAGEGAAVAAAPLSATAEPTTGPVAGDGTVLPAAPSFGLTSFEQVNLSVSLQLARIRVESRAADATGDQAPETGPLDLDDARPFDQLVSELFALADDLFERLVSGEDAFGPEGVQGLVQQVLDLFGQGFDDALRILDDFGAQTLTDGTPVQGVFEAAFTSVELHVSQTRIQTADGTVLEQTSLSLRVTQVQIQGTVGAALAPDQPAPSLSAPETPEDVAQNIADFASQLFGVFRAQNPQLDDRQALADFIALTQDAAAEGAHRAEQILNGLNLLDEEREAETQEVLTRLADLLADRFPQLSETAA